MKPLLKFGLTIFFITFLLGNDYTDSLKQELNKAKNSKKVKILLELAEIAADSSLKIQYTDRAFKLSKELNYRKGIGDCYYSYGRIRSMLKRFDEAITFYTKSLVYFREIKDKNGEGLSLFKTGDIYYKKKNLGEALKYYKIAAEKLYEAKNFTMACRINRNCGVLYESQGDFLNSLKHYNETLKIYNQINDKKGIAKLLQDIGGIYYLQGNLTESLKYMIRAVELNLNTQNYSELANNYGNIANVYAKEKKNDSAIVYFNKSIQINKKTNNYRSLAIGYYNLANSYLSINETKKAADSFENALKNYSQLTEILLQPTLLTGLAMARLKLGEINPAYKLFNQATEINKKIGDPSAEALITSGLSQYYLKTNNTGAAKKYASSSLMTSLKSGIKTEIIESLSMLYQICEKSGDFFSALNYHKRMKEYSDSLLDENKSHELGRLEARFEFVKKENELKKKHEEEKRLAQDAKEKLIYISLIITSWLILVGAGSFWYTKKLKTKNEIINGQNKQLEEILSDLHETQDALIHKEKMASLGVMVAGIAHEINNPVNYITSSVYALENKIKELRDCLRKIEESSEIKSNTEFLKKQLLPENFNLLLDGIKEGSVRITKIISVLNNMAHKETAVKMKCDLKKEIDTAITFVSHKMNENIKIEKNYEDKNIPVNCDSDKIHQVFSNILLNSMDALDGEGNIKINLQYCDNDSEVKIEFEDNGMGIPERNIDKIFDPFFTTKDVGKGVGLGLSITYEIIKRHNGEIFVENLEKGTRITVKLPVDYD